MDGHAKAGDRARYGSRLVALGSIGLVVAVVPATAVATPTTTPTDRVAVSAPPGRTNASLFGVAGVPHSSDVWVLGSDNSPEGRTFEARRHDGHWRRFRAPKVGIYGEVMGIAAASPRLVWVVGSAQQGHTTKTRPAVWRWTGKRFVLAKLPKLLSADVSGVAIAASSATNAWVVGTISRAGSRKAVALHWDGKSWSAVSTPTELDEVSTSGPRNAWAIGGEGTELVHWDGKSWSAAGETPLGVVVNAIATSSPSLAYAVGSSISGHGQVHTAILQFNGKAWSRAAIASGVPSAQPYSVAMHGTSAWALGSHEKPDGVDVPVILHTGGGTWSTQKPPGGRAYLLNAVSAPSAKRAYAVGYYLPGGGAGRTFLDVYRAGHWQGAASRF